MIELRLITKTIAGKAVLENSNLVLPSTGFVFLRGANGAGKSTLMGILAGRDTDYVGSLSIDGVELHGQELANYADETVSYCPQDSLIFDNETALDNILIPFVKRDKKKAMDILSSLGLGKLAKSYAGDLSSGEAQRLSVGRSLYSGRPIVLLDEPTSFLDENNASLLLKALLNYSKTHLVIISNNEDIPEAYQGYPVISIKDGMFSFSASNSDKAADNAKLPLPKIRGHLRSLLGENTSLIVLLTALNAVFLACSVFFGVMLTSQSSDVFRGYWLDQRGPEYSKLAFAEDSLLLPYSGNEDYEGGLLTVHEAMDIGVNGQDVSLWSYEILSFVTTVELASDTVPDLDYDFLLGSMPSEKNEIALPKWGYILLCDSLGVEDPLSAESFAGLSSGLEFDFDYSQGAALSLSGVFDCPEPVGLSVVLNWDFSNRSYLLAYFFPSTHAIVNLGDQYGYLPGARYAPNNEANRKEFLNSPYFWNIEFNLLNENGQESKPLSYYTGSNYPMFYLSLGLTVIATISILLAYCAFNRDRFLLLRLAGAKRNALLFPRIWLFCGLIGLSFLLGFTLGIGAAYAYQSYYLSTLIIGGAHFIRIGADAILVPFAIAVLDAAIAFLLFSFHLMPKDTSRSLLKAKEK